MGKCLRLTFFSFFALIGLTGTLLVFYGGFNSHFVPLAGARADNIDSVLDSFIRCTDKARDVLNDDTSVTYRLMVGQCAANSASLLILAGFAGTFTLCAMISAIVSNCRDVKGNQYVFSVLSSVSMGLLVVSLAIMSAAVWPTMQKLVPCQKLGLSATDIAFIDVKLGMTCVTSSNSTAFHWLGNIAAFYAGAGISIFCLVVFMLLNACCGGAKGGPSEPLPLKPRAPDGHHNL